MDARMNVMIPAICVLILAAAYILHGGWLAKRWGVDPTRKTPAALGRPGKRRGRGIAASMLGVVCAVLWLAAWLYLMVWEGFANEGYGELAGFGAVTLCVLVCARLSFAALFMSVRKDEDLAQAAGEELFPAAEKILYVLTALAMLSLSGCTLMMILKDVIGGSYAVNILYSAAGWMALCMASASQRMAPVITSERHMQGASYGGAVFTGMLTIAWFSLEALGANVERSVWGAAALIMLLAGWLYPACLGADAVLGLLKSPLPKKKKAPDVIWTLLCIAATIALGLAGEEWLMILSGCVSIAYVLLSAIVCAKWFGRIGRGLFSKN